MASYSRAESKGGVATQPDEAGEQQVELGGAAAEQEEDAEAGEELMVPPSGRSNPTPFLISERAFIPHSGLQRDFLNNPCVKNP